MNGAPAYFVTPFYQQY